MKLFDRCRTSLAHLALAALLVTALPVAPIQAGLVSTDQVISETFGTIDDRARVQDFLARADVREQLAALGVDPAEAAARVAALSDDEIATIAGELDHLPAGEGVVMTAFVVAGVLLLVLVITDLAGITDVFTFIN
jgi:hypothetical protein